MDHYQIVGLKRVAAFIAQIGHESGQLKYVKEIWRPARLTERGKTIDDLVDLLAELRSETDGYAGELAAALTASRRAGFAYEASYDAIAAQR